MSDDALVSALERRIPHLLRQQRIPGVSVAVGRAGRIVWEDAFGGADLARGHAMTPDTVFPSGSMGKVMTATAVLQLVERGVLALDDAVERHVDFPVRNPLGHREITVADLLTHRSGLTQNGARCTLSRPRPLGEHLRAVFAGAPHEYYHGALPRWFAPVGEATQYSNTGMALLGHLVEVTNPDGQSFSEYVQRNLLDVLGMGSTQFPAVQDGDNVRPDLWARRTVEYASFGGLHVPSPRIHLTEYPAGAAMTTAADLLRLLMAHLGDGALGDRRVLGTAAARRMRRNETGGTRPHHGMDFGLMWMLGDDAAPRFIGHGGAHMYGFSGWMTGYPDLDLGVVVLTNRWPMTDWEADGAGVEARFDIPAFAAARAADADDAASGDDGATWAWKASYLAGLLLAERTLGLMGVEETLAEPALDLMIAGAHAQADCAHLWDAGGFRQGWRDLEAAPDHSHDGIGAFMASDAMRLPRDEIDLLYRDLGGHGRPSLPLPAPAQTQERRVLSPLESHP